MNNFTIICSKNLVKNAYICNYKSWLNCASWISHPQSKLTGTSIVQLFTSWLSIAYVCTSILITTSPAAFYIWGSERGSFFSSFLSILPLLLVLHHLSFQLPYLNSKHFTETLFLSSCSVCWVSLPFIFFPACEGPLSPPLCCVFKYFIFPIRLDKSSLQLPGSSWVQGKRAG